jgi:hypothetical protein
MPTIHWSEINWLAILVAGFATFMLGGAWYTALFGKAWQAAHGFSEAQIKQAQAQMSPARFSGGMLMCYVLLALGMAIVVQWCRIHTLAGGASLGLVVGLAIVTPVVLTNHMPSMVKPAGFVIDASFSLIYCTLIGTILGAWQW